MSKPPHYEAAYELGASVARARAAGDKLPFPRVASADALWKRIMGDAHRGDWPANTLRQLRAEFERGFTDHE